MLMLAGCGGGESAEPTYEQQVVTVIEAYNVAVADANGRKACALLSSEGVQVVREAREEEDCEEAIKKRYSAEPEEEIFEALKFAKVSNVQVRGNEARATVGVPAQSDGPATAELVREGNRWLISHPAGLTGANDFF